MKKLLTLITPAIIALTLPLAAKADPPMAQQLSSPTDSPSAMHCVTVNKTKKASSMLDRYHQREERKRRAAIPGDFSLQRMLSRATPGFIQMQAPDADAQLPDLAGLVIAADDWVGGDERYAIHELGDNGTWYLMNSFFDKSTPGLLYPGYGAVVKDGTYYQTHYERIRDGLYLYYVAALDVWTGRLLWNRSDVVQSLAISMAEDPTTGIVYGLSCNEEEAVMNINRYNFSPEGYSYSKVATLSDEYDWNALACDNTGQLYGIYIVTAKDVGGGEIVEKSVLARIDKESGLVTPVGVTGQCPAYLSDATIDEKTNRMYWTVAPDDGSGSLYEINLQTGAATYMCTFTYNEEVVCLHMVTPEAEDKAPNSPSSLRLNVTPGSLSGNITFDAPTTLFDRTPARGEVSYTVTLDGNKIATGTTSYGGHETVPISVAGSGEKEFYVYCSNEAGDSPRRKICGYMGMGRPVKTSSVELSYGDGKMKLTWKPVSEVLDRGFINPADITYTIHRVVNDGEPEIAAQGLGSTSFEEAMSEPEDLTKYYYTVTVCNGDMTSEAVGSNTISMGSIGDSYFNNFDAPDALAGFTIIDANNDRVKWTTLNGTARIAYSNYSDRAMDDWLITPGIKLQGGKAYLVSFKARIELSSPERLEVCWGTEPTVAGMTGVLIEPTDISSRKFVELSAYMTPKADGTYYVGIHGISEPDRYYLYIDDLSISSASSTDMPAPVSNLTASNNPDGEYITTLKFKTPSTDMGGKTLESINRIEIKREEAIIKTFDNPQPGVELSHTDILGRAGTYNYTVQAFNEFGGSELASLSQFVGTPIPAMPQNLTIAENQTGVVTLSWDAVDKDYQGNPINPARVKYQVYAPSGNSWSPVSSSSTSETSVTIPVAGLGRQRFVQYAIFPSTDAGMGEGAVSEMIPVGTPHKGLSESFTNSQLHYNWSIRTAGDNVEYGFVDDKAYTDLKSQDNDNGFFMITAQNPGEGAALISGKIDLSGINNPVLDFYTAVVIPQNTNTIQVAVKEAGSSEFTDLDNPVTLGGIYDGCWGRIIAPLAAYSGKIVQVRITCTVESHTLLALDNIRVEAGSDRNLSITGISAPENVTPGTEYSVDVRVSNTGVEAAENFTVNLYVDGSQAATKTVGFLASGKTSTVSLTAAMHVLAEQSSDIHVSVDFSGDENPADNESAVLTVTPLISRLPAVTDLRGETDGNDKPHLLWSEPDMNAMEADPITCDFEDGNAFASEYDGWVFVDVDGNPVSAFSEPAIPGITNYVTKASFIVFDNSPYVEIFAGFDSHSGRKYLASFYSSKGYASDDWAISPELSGTRQTVRFHARGYDEEYPEKIEVYYSTGSTDPSDFIKINGVGGTIPKEWTAIEFELPAGALRFAVRSCSSTGWMLMLDDFTFIPGGPGAEIGILGYDIYRNGEKINSEYIEENEFTDTEAAADTSNEYRVVAVYDKGMSAGSNSVTVITTGIGGVTADRETEYFNLQGFRVEKPSPGNIYIRRQGGRADKVYLR